MHLSNVRNRDAFLVRLESCLKWSPDRVDYSVNKTDSNPSLYFFSAPVVHSKAVKSPDHPSNDDDENGGFTGLMFGVFGAVFIFGLMTLFMCW